MSVSGGGALGAVAANGEMAARVRAFDWSRTPLGPMREWPRSLLTLVDLLLSQPIPTIILWGPELTQIYNDAYAVIAASKHPAALGQPNRECWPEALALTEPIYRRVLDAGERVLLDDQLIPLDRRGTGTLEDAYFTVSYSPARGDDGRVGGIFVTVIETTDRRAAERAREEKLVGEQLRRGYETFYNLVQNDPFGVYVVDADFRLAEVSRGAQKVFANVARPLLGRDFAAVLRVVWPEPFASEAIGRFRHTLETGEPYAAPGTVERRADTPEVEAYDWRIERITLPDGRPGVVCYFYDLSERQRWEAELAEARRKLDSALLAGDVGTFEWDVPGDRLWGDRNFARIFGVPLDEGGAPIAGYVASIHPDDRAGVMARVNRTVETGCPYEAEYRVARGGETRWVVARGTGERDAGGRVVRFPGVVVDVTDRRRAEAAAREGEARLKVALGAARMVVWEYEPATGKATVSEGAADLYGLGPGERLGSSEHGFALMHPDDAERHRATFAKALADGAGYVTQFRMMRRDGAGVVWVEERAHAVRDPGGKVERLVGVHIDITERKRAEDLAQDILESVTDGFFSLDGGWRFVYVNAAAERFLLRGRGELVGRNIWTEFPSAVGTNFEREYRLAMTERRPVRFVEHYPPPLDAWYEVRAYPSATGISVYFQDVTERRRADEALREARERLELTLDAGELGTFYCPLPLGRVDWNERCKEHFFLPPDAEVDIDLFYSILHPDDRAPTREAVERAVYGRAAYDVQYRTVAPDGRERWVRAKGRAYYDDAGQPTRLDGVTIDVTDLKAIEEERSRLLDAERAAREDAEAASRMKDEFLATLSHELRTPLNAILGWAQILGRGARSEDDVRQGLDVIARNARAQTQIIEDLLDMSRIVSGKIRLDVQRLDLAAVLTAAVDTVRPAADAKGVRLQAVLDPTAGPVSGDPSRLQQVFWNLLTNAVKFTPRDGRVQVLLNRVNPHVEASVIDTGEGIEPAFLPYVFDRFRQADATTTRRHGGLGLGLSIVKQLVELHGGQVRVESGGPGKGSTFVVALPLAVIHPEPEPEATRRHPKATAPSPLPADACPKVEGVKVLVVDDEPDARALVKRLLEDCEAVVATAGSAEEAMERFRADRPDVLVSDVGMPGEDGYSLIRRVRALGREAGGDVPAIALTAYARAEDRVKAVVAGFQQHVVKPVEPAELVTLVAVLAGRSVG